MIIWTLSLRVIHILDRDVKKNLDGVMEWLGREIKTPRQTSSATPLKRGISLRLPARAPSERGE